MFSYVFLGAILSIITVLLVWNICLMYEQNEALLQNNVFTFNTISAMDKYVKLSLNDVHTDEKNECLTVQNDLEKDFILAEVREAVFELKNGFSDISRTGDFILSNVMYKFKHVEMIDLFCGKITVRYLVVWGKNNENVPIEKRYGFMVLSPEGYKKWMDKDTDFISKMISAYEEKGCINAR